MAATSGNTAILAALDLDTLTNATSFGAVAYFADDATLRTIRQALSARNGAIIPLLTAPEDNARLRVERHVCIDTTAAGGNATLMAQAG